MIIHHSILRVATASSLIILTTLGSVAQVGITRPQKVALPITWQWATEDWKEDNVKYHNIRVEIESEKVSNNFSPALIDKYKAIWNKDRTDPIKLFQWAYASFLGTQSNPPIFQLQVVAPGVFDEIPSPKSYEFARLRFLVTAHYSPDARLQSVGERLLRQVPDDYDVKYYLIQCYDPWRFPIEKQKALALAESLVRSMPNRPGAYSALGSIYFNSWMVGRQQNDADKAVAAYQKYLQVAPSNYGWRENAQKLITYIETHSKHKQ